MDLLDVAPGALEQGVGALGEAPGDGRQADAGSGATSKPSARSARPTVATISLTSYGSASAIHHARPGGVGVSSARTMPCTRLST